MLRRKGARSGSPGTLGLGLSTAVMLGPCRRGLMEKARSIAQPSKKPCREGSPALSPVH